MNSEAPVEPNELVEPDQFQYENLKTFITETLLIALVDYRSFWAAIIGQVHGLGMSERERLAKQITTIDLIGGGEFTRDHHFQFLVAGTYNKAVQALVGVLIDPVTAYEIYESTGFNEDDSFLERLSELLTSPITLRPFGVWLMRQAETGNHFAVLRTEPHPTRTNPAPTWWLNQRATLDKHPSHWYLPNSKYTRTNDINPSEYRNTENW